MFLLGLGVAGLVLPVLQGILFLVIGLTLLSSESVYARRCLEWLRSHWPHRRLSANRGGQSNG